MNPHLKLCIARFSRLISNAEEKAKDLYGIKDLSSAQISYMETIGELTNPNMTELATAIGVKKPSATVVIERLITKGCIYKTHSDADRRSTHLHLTEIGKQVNQRHDIAHGYLAEIIEGALTPVERIQFTELLTKVLESDKIK